MLIDMDFNNGSGGGTKIPFTLQAYSNRVVFSSQNCYIYDDNGVLTIHYEYTCTGNGTDTNATIMRGNIPAITRTTPSGGIPSNSGWRYSMGSGGTYVGLMGNYTNGTVYSVNEDVACDWNN